MFDYISRSISFPKKKRKNDFANAHHRRRSCINGEAIIQRDGIVWKFMAKGIEPPKESCVRKLFEQTGYVVKIVK